MYAIPWRKMVTHGAIANLSLDISTTQTFKCYQMMYCTRLIRFEFGVDRLNVDYGEFELIWMPNTRNSLKNVCRNVKFSLFRVWLVNVRFLSAPEYGGGPKL